MKISNFECNKIKMRDFSFFLVSLGLSKRKDKKNPQTEWRDMRGKTVNLKKKSN